MIPPGEPKESPTPVDALFEALFEALCHALFEALFEDPCQALFEPSLRRCARPSPSPV